MSNDLANAWPDNCNGSSGATSDDVATHFYLNDNAANWTDGPSSTGYHTLGYGYTGGSYFKKCASGSNTTNGTFPGEPNQDTTRSLVCPCFAQ